MSRTNQDHKKGNNNFSWNDSVSLKEYFDEKFRTNEVALELQEKEYARRLDALNGEGERLRQMQSTYIPREVYEANHKELCNKVERLEAYNNQAIGKNSIIAVIVSVGISMAFLLINFILR